MEKLLKQDLISFDITKGITIEEFNDRYNECLKYLKDKYDYITDIKIHSDSGEYNDGEDHYEEIDIYYKRYETDEEFVPPCKFKVGDKIRHKGNDIYCTLEEYSEGISAYRTNIGLSLTHKDFEDWELVPNKFDITTLVPFESRVLIRDHESQKWRPAIWGCYDDDKYFPYRLIGTISHCCIPYEGNEHLLNNTDDCDEYYKNWE